MFGMSRVKNFNFLCYAAVPDTVTDAEPQQEIS